MAAFTLRMDRRLRLARWTRALTGLVLVAAVACGGQPLFKAHGKPEYEVTTTLMQKPRGPVVACHAIPLPDPPIGCGGITVRGFDINQGPGAHTYPNGVRSTGPVRLVGTWSGSSL